MENELIIDGQAIPVSKNQETPPQNTAEQPAQECENNAAQVQKVDTDNIEIKSDQEVEQDQDYSLQIGDEEISLSEEDDSIEGKPAPKWVKDLRKGFKETQKENRDLKRQLEELATRQSHQSPINHDNVIPAKPTLESCDYDEKVYEKALTDWHEEKSHVEQKKQVQQRQQQEVRERFIQRLKSHQQRAAKLPVKDYTEMEEVVRSEIPILQQEILIHAADEGTELIAYAIGKNKALRQRLTAENDPIRAAFLLGQISQKVKLAPKPKKTSKPEPALKGGAGNVKSDEFTKLCPGAIIE
ncbi:phage scaffold protein [Candidatus Williamhamiltonella defendens]|uniref:Phage capsid protein n=1 Tax=Candidatus Hamiltonella defensa (Bemisia tabaci) TaxID=672795 RepID=A0A249DX67_9ENTR|nr:phage scaffold protein [Candidatus Hamiltonella defensa]ACJ10117.1 scaffold protein gp8 [Bacteriophage APSE-7]ASX26128.1 phage capsid protein [Candidatus Hamiltonella defensa (Bemisia tabaci)]CED78243.1 APSE-2 prophage scaffold protein, gp8 [Candidatus Hamiltonella defensa (Bemisia tabaci)]